MADCGEPRGGWGKRLAVCGDEHRPSHAPRAMLGSAAGTRYRVISLKNRGKNLWCHLARHWLRHSTPRFSACYLTLT